MAIEILYIGNGWDWGHIRLFLVVWVSQVGVLGFSNSCGLRSGHTKRYLRSRGTETVTKESKSQTCRDEETKP